MWCRYADQGFLREHAHEEAFPLPSLPAPDCNQYFEQTNVSQTGRHQDTAASAISHRVGSQEARTNVVCIDGIVVVKNISNHFFFLNNGFIFDVFLILQRERSF